jgi:hypothetical protein
MVMLNDLDRFHLVMDVIDRVDGLATRAASLRQRMADARLSARRYTREHGETIPPSPAGRGTPTTDAAVPPTSGRSTSRSESRPRR